MKSTASALFVICVLLSLPAAAAAAGSSFTDDVPLRGGIAALSDVIPISPAPDRARFLAEAVRVVYSWPQTGPYSNEPTRRRIADFLADAKSRDAHDDIPVPLTAAIWSQAVFHKTVSREDLAGAILADRTAALLAYSLAGMDDETLQFVADHPSLLSRIAERAPAIFGAFGESVRIHNGRVVVPGGDAAAAAWESVAGEKLDRPERFLQQLFEADRGRLAYLFDVLSRVDAPLLSATLGGADALKRLAALARRAFPEWEVATAPFVRPAGDLSAFFGRVHLATEGEGGAPVPGTTSFWQKVFNETAGGGDSRVDIAWLAETVTGHPARERERRLDLLGFMARVFATAPGDDETIGAAHGFGSFTALMLTLERIGIRTPSLYSAAARQADALTSLDSGRGAIAIGQFQGAVALIARLVTVRTIDIATAERLARELFALRLDNNGYYGGAIGTWLVDRVAAALPPPSAGATIDDVIVVGVAGPARTAAAPRVEWEGQRYLVDPGGAELARLRRTRDRQEGITFATALGVTALVRRLNAATPPTIDVVRNAAMTLDAAATELAVADRAADEPAIRSLRDASRTLSALTRPADLADARRVAGTLLPIADALVSHALVSLAYACDLGDPDGTILIAGDPSRRHDFGYDVPGGRDARLKAVWGIATVETRHGPWHLVGSAFALDLAMAPLALRRISIDRVPSSPMLNLMQRDGFAATVAAMNGALLSDADRDRITDHIGEGRRRVARLAGGGESADTVSRAIDLDGWRTRALSWTVAHDPSQAASLLSLTELLVLGGGSPSAFNSWGTFALRTAGCLCSRLAAPGEWRHWWGLSQAGLPAILVADLPLNAAVVLHNLKLPAVLAKPVLAAAMQDFVDATNPTDGNDWLTLARAAQAVDRARFEDYVAAATADGPLVAESADGGK